MNTGKDSQDFNPEERDKLVDAFVDAQFAKIVDFEVTEGWPAGITSIN